MLLPLKAAEGARSSLNPFCTQAKGIGRSPPAPLHINRVICTTRQHPRGAWSRDTEEQEALQGQEELLVLQAIQLPWMQTPALLAWLEATRGVLGNKVHLLHPVFSPQRNPHPRRYLPTGQAADFPATKVLHSLGVHCGLPRGVGGPPEKQTTFKVQREGSTKISICWTCLLLLG